MTFIPPQPPGGKGSLRKFLQQMDSEREEMIKELHENPMYKEGYDDGYKKAEKDFLALASALQQVYEIKRPGPFDE